MPCSRRGTAVAAAFCTLLLPASAVRADTASAIPSWRPDTPERVAIRAQIEALSIEYYYRIDHGNSEDVIELFTPNAILEIGGQKLTGREAIRRYYANRSRTWITRHVSTNLRITYIDADHVDVIRLFTYYHGDKAESAGPYPALPSVAEYHEIVERGPDGAWRYAFRASTPVFSQH
jgi:hypothetical protein